MILTYANLKQNVAVTQCGKWTDVVGIGDEVDIASLEYTSKGVTMMATLSIQLQTCLHIEVRQGLSCQSSCSSPCFSSPSHRPYQFHHTYQKDFRMAEFTSMRVMPHVTRLLAPLFVCKQSCSQVLFICLLTF